MDIPDSPQMTNIADFGSTLPAAVPAGEQLSPVQRPVPQPAEPTEVSEVDVSAEPDIREETERTSIQDTVAEESIVVLEQAPEEPPVVPDTVVSEEPPAVLDEDELDDDAPLVYSVDTDQLMSVAGGEVAPSDGIEVLVRLAQRGEIDPKNVDIIDVTDKFLKLIAAAPKENLRQSGKILFHACVLLRMKAEALLNFTADDPSGDDFLDFDENGDAIIYDSNQQEVGRQITLKDLERAIVRRSQRRQVRKRQVTLEELIDALREAERIEKSRADRKPARAVIELAGQHDVDNYDDLLDLAHDEDVETTIEKVEILLARILKLGEKIELFRMVVFMDDHNDWVDAFLASLFLSNAGKIDLYQDEFYGPLFIGLGGSSVSDTVVT